MLKKLSKLRDVATTIHQPSVNLQYNRRMLTIKQKDVLEFIVSHQSKTRLSPTLEEIAGHIGVSSLSGVHQHLSSLEDKGFIERHKQKSRSIIVTSLGRKVVGGKPEHAEIDLITDFIDVEKIVNTIQKGDSIELMHQMPDNSVDLIIADPPYNLSKGTSLKLASGSLKGAGGTWTKVIENWDDFTFVEYMEFTEAWLRETKRILKPTGSMWVFGTYHNIGVVNTMMQLLGIEIINEVVWYKRNAFPNLAGRRLTASHETLIWAHSGKTRKYLFNYEYSKAYSDKADGLKAQGKQMRTVWDIPNNKKPFELEFGKHPTQKPLKICKRMIELSSEIDDIVFSPFSGSGTECLAAKITGRRYLGFEIEDEFVELSKKRLAASHAEQETLV